MTTLQNGDRFLVQRTDSQSGISTNYQVSQENLMANLADDDLLLVQRTSAGISTNYCISGSDLKEDLGGVNGLIRPPVSVLTPLNGSGITVFDQYEPLSSVITAVGEADTLTKDTDEIQSVVDDITGAVDFDGNDRLTVPSFTGAPQGTNDWTIEFYAYFASWSGNKVVTWAAETSHPNYRIAVQVESGKYYIVDGANYGASWYSSKNDLSSYTSVVAPLNKWHHVAIQRASGVDTIYIDGQVQFTAFGHTASSPSVTGNWIIGGGQSASTDLVGKLSNFRVLSGTALYSSTFTPPTTPLTNITNTVLLCCQSDSSVTEAAVSTGTLTTTGDPTATEVNVSGNKVLSFPTNTNFSGLSVGDVVQNATFNKTHPTDYSGPDSSISADNLTISCTSNRYAEAISSIPASNYSNYSEFTVDSASSNKMLGVAVGSSDTKIISGLGSYVTYREGGYVVKYPGNQTLTSSVASYTQGDVIGVAIDSTNVTFYKNGDLQGTYAHGLSGDYYATAMVINGSVAGQNTTMTANFGATDFVHTPPTGYSKLGTSIAAIDTSAPSQTQVNAYATLDPSQNVNNDTFSNGNLTVATSVTSYGTYTSNVSTPLSGKWYAEVSVASVGNYLQLGLVDINSNFTASNFPSQHDGVVYYSYDGSRWIDGAQVAYGAGFAGGDIIGIAYDADSGSINFYKNGVDQGAITGIPAREYYFAGGDLDASATGTQSWNFGQNAWTHEPPTGYAGLSETVTTYTYPNITVSGGTWDTSNQSQIWSSSLTASSGLTGAANAFDGDVSTRANSSQGTNQTLTFAPNLGVSFTSKLEVYCDNNGTTATASWDGNSVAAGKNGWVTVFTGSGTIDSNTPLVINTNGANQFATLKGVKLDGIILVDSYEDSQVWSNNVSVTNGVELRSGSIAQMFSPVVTNSESDHRYYESNSAASTLTFDPPLTSTNGNVHMYISAYQAGNGQGVQINGSPYTLADVPGTGSAPKLFDLGTQSLSTISWTAPGGTNLRLNNPVVDGKLVVDAGHRDLGDRKISVFIPYEKSLTFTDVTELANMVTPLEMVDANGDVVTPVSDTIANVNNNVLTLASDTNVAYFQPGDEVQTGVQVVSVDSAAPSITVDGGEWLGADGTNSVQIISRSLRFSPGPSFAETPSLTRTSTTSGNRKTWTWSAWIKRGSLSPNIQRFSYDYELGPTSDPYFSIAFVNDYIQLEQPRTEPQKFYVYSEALYRDTTKWYHVVVVLDTTESTDSDRIKLYVDGERQTLILGNNWPTQNFDYIKGAAGGLQILGRNAVNHLQSFDGYMADIHYVNGQALAPTAFGELDSNGVWKAKKYEGTYNSIGQMFSNTLTTNDPAGFPSNWPKTFAFDGNISNNTFISDQSSSITWDASGYNINISTSLRVRIYNKYNLTVTTSNGTQTLSNASGIGSTFGWVDFNLTGQLLSVVNNGPGTFSVNLAAIEVDGVVLTDTPAGANGFHLDFADNNTAAALGTDSSGNSNTWTVNNLDKDNDNLVDVPANHGTDTGLGGEVRGNYCVINPLGQSPNTPTISDGNLQMTHGSSQATRLGTIGASSGKYYWEIVYTAATLFDGMVGVADQSHGLDRYVGSTSGSWGYYYTGNTIHAASGVSYGSSWTTNDVISIALDMDNLAIYFAKNGVWQNSGDPTSGSNKTGAAYTNLSGTIFPAINAYGGTQVVNWGARPFAYAAPSGYKALCDTNLPEATIKDGSNHFDTITYTGNGSTQTISGLGFSPDLVWLKSRSSALNHRLVDSVQGVTSTMASNLTYAAHNSSSEFTALNSDGFSLTQGGSFGLNGSGSEYVAWAWNAGDTTTTIAAGDLTSSIYNQSRDWSTTSTGGNNSSHPKEGMFDGVTDTTSYPGMATSSAATTSGNNLVVNFTESDDLTGTLQIYFCRQSNTASTSAVRVEIDEIIGGIAVTRDITSFMPDTTTTNDGGLSALTLSSEITLLGPLVKLEIITGAGLDRGFCSGIVVGGQLLVDSGVSVPSVPSLASTVRANPAAGFSIVSYTANNANSSVAHGLNTAPGMILVKNRDQNYNWTVYHDSLDRDKCLFLNLTNVASNNSAAPQFNSSKATSTTFPIGIGGNTNYPGGSEMIAYCFAPVEGYSAMGSYTGNGSTDGTFVYTGFKPAWILIKSATSGDPGHWMIVDTKRSPSNPADNRLHADLVNSEFENYGPDILSNGFKLRNSSTIGNINGTEYIYMAFAENPVAQDAQTVTTGDTQVALNALVASATEIVETDGTTMYLNNVTGPWRTGLSIEGSQINDAPPGPSEVTFTSMNDGTTPVSMIDATLSTRTWTLESGASATGPWTLIDSYVDFDALDSQNGATPWTTTKPTLQPNTFYRIKVSYDSTNADSVESVLNTFKTGDA